MKKKTWPDRVCLCVSVCVGLNVRVKIDSGGKTTGPIGTREVPFDKPERRKNDAINRGVIGPTRHVPRDRDPLRYFIIHRYESCY